MEVKKYNPFAVIKPKVVVPSAIEARSPGLNLKPNPNPKLNLKLEA